MSHPHSKSSFLPTNFSNHNNCLMSHSHTMISLLLSTYSNQFNDRRSIIRLQSGVESFHVGWEDQVQEDWRGGERGSRNKTSSWQATTTTRKLRTKIRRTSNSLQPPMSHPRSKSSLLPSNFSNHINRLMSNSHAIMSLLPLTYSNQISVRQSIIRLQSGVESLYVVREEQEQGGRDPRVAIRKAQEMERVPWTSSNTKLMLESGGLLVSEGTLWNQTS